MGFEPRTALNSLDFGPLKSSVMLNRKVFRLCTQLVILLMLMSFGFSASDLSTGGTDDGSHGSAVPGTALIAPNPNSPELPHGMILASSVSNAQAEAPEQDPAATQRGGDDEASSALSAPERMQVEDLPFLLESLADLDRDLPPALYYYFLDKARKASPEALIADGRRDVTFSHLYKDPRRDPAKYRGQLLRLSGTVRRALAYDIEENAYGLTRRYELWVFTEDSGKFPWVVQLTELPPGFPLGTDIREQVETAGYFLKLWAYRAQDGYRSAPLLLGHGLEWRRTDQLRKRFDRQFGIAALAFLGIFTLVLGWNVRRWRIEDRANRERRRTVEPFERLDEIPVIEPPEDGSFS